MAVLEAQGCQWGLVWSWMEAGVLEACVCHYRRTPVGIQPPSWVRVFGGACAAPVRSPRGLVLLGVTGLALNQREIKTKQNRNPVS